MVALARKPEALMVLESATLEYLEALRDARDGRIFARRHGHRPLVGRLVRWAAGQSERRLEACRARLWTVCVLCDRQGHEEAVYEALSRVGAAASAPAEGGGS